MNTQLPTSPKQIIIITGANSGIGRQMAKSLYNNGNIVIFGARNIFKNTQAIEYIKNGHKQNIQHQQHKHHQHHQHNNDGFISACRLDLCNKQSIQQFVQYLINKLADINKIQSQHVYIDILINNAGLLGQHTLQTQTQNNIQQTLLANHFGHFYLTYLLMPLLKKSKQGGRIINISSDIHYKIKAIDGQKGQKLQKDQYNVQNIWDLKCQNKGYDSLQQYGVSKFYNILFTLGLQEFINKHKLYMKTVCLHPGFVDTNFGSFSQMVQNIKKQYGQYMITPEAGAQGTLALCQMKFEDLREGEYHNEKGEHREMNGLCRNKEYIQKLWDISQKLYQIQWEGDYKKLEDKTNQ